MSAPVNRILDEFTRCVRAAFPEGTVETNRARSISDDQRELPFLNVKQGAVDPLAGGATFDTLSAVLNVTVEIFAKATDSKELLATLNEYVVRTHAAVMPLLSLQLSFVREVGWLGQSEPLTDVGGVDVSAQIDAKFQVAFDFNRDNPNVE